MDLSPVHLITVGVTAAAIAALVVAARKRPGPWTVPVARALAVLIVVNETSWFAWQAAHHAFTLQNDLPLHLCDVAAYISAVALWLRTPLLVELTYFWGIAGTANGVITPDIGDQFPSYLFFQYFIQHGAIPAAGLFLVVGLKIYPRAWAVPRVIALSLGLLVFDALVNLLTNGNYLFLRSVPPGPNLLTVLGPWPWYIVWGAIVAIAIFILLDAPFRISGLGRGRSKTERYPRPASPPSLQPPPGR
ncbi:MAG TPA: TIGR02206 family membrane protein [Candidatus Dormibacteraeota bacterium]|nr:TIGR02206 family membrane protein [Candidatus Dormibacteraeota bacterium]